MINYYQILEISRNADEIIIRKAYRLNAIKYHPDKHFGDKYFEEKFKEINEAYTVLINSESKKEYDKKWDSYFTKVSSKEFASEFNESTAFEKEFEKEGKFQYNPHRPFYNSQDRFNNDTPQHTPKMDHWGNRISDEMEFICLPKKIGVIISGYSTLKKTDKPLSTLRMFLNILFYASIAVVISVGIILVAEITNPVLIFTLVSLLVLIIIWIRIILNKFKHSWNFIGINGFAEYNLEGSRENIVKSVEVNFNELTDLFIEYKKNGYEFSWLNYKTKDRVIHTDQGIYDKDDLPKDLYSSYWLNKEAEKYWTIYLLDNMERELLEKGFIEFRLIDGMRPYIRIGIGFISFLKEKESCTYKFNEIKNIYIKGTDIYIEHLNYQKVFLFFRSGNTDKIPLINLLNLRFFFEAIYILLGYKF
jgi:curved DNA-binding protein CbpA